MNYCGEWISLSPVSSSFACREWFLLHAQLSLSDYFLSCMLRTNGHGAGRCSAELQGKDSSSWRVDGLTVPGTQ